MEEVVQVLSRNPGIVALAGFVLFVIGIGTGMLLSSLPFKRIPKVPSTPKKLKELEKTPVLAELSPVKLLHRIASNFLKSSARTDATSSLDYAVSAETARDELYKLLGLTSDTHAHHSVNWQHVFSNTETQFWVSSSTRSGIKLRGETFVDASACSVVNWILQKDSVTGIEGLGGKTEVVSRTSADNEIIIVRKIFCKAGSGIMSSKRDFKLITSITMQDDGTYVIATRSGPWDFGGASTGGGDSSNSATSNTDSQKVDLSKGYIRGIVHASGFILRPIIDGDNVGCELSFGCHVDMKGTRSGRGNTANVNLILASILRVIKCIQNGEADQFDHLNGQTLRYIDQVGSWGKSLGMSNNHPSQSELQAGVEAEPIENESTGDLLVKLHIPTQQLLFNASLPTTADKYRLLSVARDAANRLRAQYQETIGPDSRGVLPRTSFSGPPEIRRETFYEQDGIVLKELHKDYISPFGVFSATFQVQAAPEAVKKLLVFRPDSIDGFLEGRSILNYLSPESYVQYMAYGALFPLRAKDLLLVTTVEPWDKKDSRGFVIASTSIDNMCEMSRPHAESLSSASGGESAPISKYIRGNLRLGGYIGIPNEDGSTTLTFVIDISLEAQKSSAWLMRYLAQYSLTELVGRIRHAVSPFNLGTDRSLLSQSTANASGRDSEGENDTTPGSPKFLGGGGTRTEDLGRMLASIQRREQGVTKRCNTVERVPVSHHRRDRTNSVEYFNPTEEPAGESRSRLDSDQSVGYSTWKEVRSRANSTVARESAGDMDEAPRSGGRNRGGSTEGRYPPHSPAPPPSPSSNQFSLQAPDGIASAHTPTHTPKEKSRSTFSMLKRSLSKKPKHPRKPVAATAATTLYMANIDDGEDSDYKIGTPQSTPNASPRVQHQKSMPFPLQTDEPPSPSLASLVPARLRRTSRGGGEEVDYDSVQRELGKISPSRRPSKTMQAMRRRSMSQTEEPRSSSHEGVSSGAERATISALPGQSARGIHAAPSAVHRSASSGDALRLGEPVGNHVLAAQLSQSMNDLPAASEKRATEDLSRAAWKVYQTYFDPVRCRKELGIDWQLKLNKPNIHIYSSMVENNSWCAIKAVTIMNTTPMALVEVLLNYDRMGEYDNMFKKSQLVQRVDASTVIQRLMFKEVWPTAPRDFVVCASWRQNEDGSVSIVSRSAPDTLCAQEKGYVRGFLQVSGYLLEPYNAERPVSVPLSCANGGVLSPGECKVTLLNHTELGGTLPASVINVLSTNAPMKILATLSDIVSTK